MSSIETSVDAQRLLPEQLEDRLFAMLARSAGVALCVVAVFGWISLLTWSVADPSLTRGTTGAIRNLLGSFGANLSDMLLQMLGLGAILALIAPVLWGLDLILAGRIPRLRWKAALVPAGTLAIAGGLAALPVPALWPIHPGLGGILGELVFNVAASLLGSLHGGRAEVFAGLTLSGLGLAALSFGFGLAGRDLAARIWDVRGRRSVHIEPSATLREPAFEASMNDFDAEPELPSARRAAAVARAHAPRARTPRAPRAPAALPEVSENADFDDETARQSRAIAERFAPANSARGVGIVDDRDEILVTPPAIRPRVTAPTTRGLDIRAQRDRLMAEFEDWEADDDHAATVPPRPAVARPCPAEADLRLQIEAALAQFGVAGRVRNVINGPALSTYMLEPVHGVKLERLLGLADEIGGALQRDGVRFAAETDGTIAIEVPRAAPDCGPLGTLLCDDAFLAPQLALPIGLGWRRDGNPLVADLASLKSLLIAGEAQSGKSTLLEVIGLSLASRLAPEDCRLVVLDPTGRGCVRLGPLPHLGGPVVSDAEDALVALEWAGRECDERLKRMAELGVRSAAVFNNRVRHAQRVGAALTRTVQTGFDSRNGRAVYERKRLKDAPIVPMTILIDDLDTMLAGAPGRAEQALARLITEGPAAGVHVVAAAKPAPGMSGLARLAARFPSRVALKLSRKIDSRSLLGATGAENLLDRGDALLALAADAAAPAVTRVSPAQLDAAHLEAVVEEVLSRSHVTAMRAAVTARRRSA